ncbi:MULTISPECIES: DUF1415 domain-containing protein [Methylomonas]|uniref:Uncharacterized protein n=1 Tax=Methylomonas koyamae TaxID=702114 RepID=A0A291IGY7_9GAMM|nr:MULTISPECIES: DUF1415 domain-containing protein [Methylomonas]ANE54920.1 hypothetical protein AYM39_06840 [Methylomonas sp. DH-1]ATG89635.1 hypothetical protein MKLM6_1384 [Methylomonas koyamae]OAI29098.1 hypothetical protein A1356_05150 [Methylomonas koyamae]
MSNQQIIAATQAWLNSFVIAYNICPFAKREQQRNRIRYRVEHGNSIESCLNTLIDECIHLDTHPETETTLLILAEFFDDFDDYLDLLAIAEQLLIDQGYEGVYQLASFHPHYRFADSDETDPANYTNRSPYPMLHLLRESSIENALATYPDPAGIPQRNIELTRRLGMKKLEEILRACFESASSAGDA